MNKIVFRILTSVLLTAGCYAFAGQDNDHVTLEEAKGILDQAKLPYRTLEVQEDGRFDIGGLCPTGNLSVLRKLPLRKLEILKTDDAVQNLTFLYGVPVEELVLDRVAVTNLTPLQKSDLVSLSIAGTGLTNLAALRSFVALKHLDISAIKDVSWSVLSGMALTNLTAEGFAARDLMPLKGLPLRRLNLRMAEISHCDLSSLVGMPLEVLILSGTSVADISALEGAKSLKVLDISGTRVSDISPLAGLPLKYLNLAATKVSDLAALNSMSLDTLDISGCVELHSLKSLQGAQIMNLYLSFAKVTDLSPIAGMPLKRLHLNGTPVSDLAALRGMPLENLRLGATQVADISPLKGMPLKWLDLLGSAQIKDISPLQGMSLEWIQIDPTLIKKGMDALRDMKGLQKIYTYPHIVPDGWTPTSFWKAYDSGRWSGRRDLVGTESG